MADNALFEPGFGTPAAGPGNALMAAPPTPADAYQFDADAVMRSLRGAATAAQDPQTWKDAANAYGQALLAGSTTPGFRAFHGSPHNFDQFSLGAIGTGEGAQAYGHGLYFADKEGVARSYRDALAQPTFGGKPYDSSDPAMRAALYVHTFNDGDPAAALSQIADEHATMLSRLQNLKQMYPGVTDEKVMSGVGQPYVDAIQNLAATKQHIESGAPLPEVGGKGHMYEVQVNADPAHFLDWDAPRDKQPASVQAFFSKNHPDVWDQAADGSSLYRLLEQKFRYDHPDYAAGGLPPADWQPDRTAASQALNVAGIPGIRYLDGGSRADGTGTSNHVIFDPATIEILRKYGIAGLIAGGGAAAAGQTEQ